MARAGGLARVQGKEAELPQVPARRRGRRRPARARGGRALHSVRVRARRLLAAAGEASTVSFSFSLARLEDWCAFGARLVPPCYMQFGIICKPWGFLLLVVHFHRPYSAL